MFDIASLFAAQHPDLVKKHPRISQLMINFGRWLWKEDIAQAFVKEHENIPRVELIDKGFEFINFDLIISDEDLAKIPKTGRLLLISNHPLGILDGVGLIKKMRAIRPDVKLMLNGSLHTMLNMPEHTIPVDNFHGAISKSVLKELYQHLDNEGVVMIFPAGLTSGFRQWGVNDYHWNPSFIYFAQKKNCPILPVFISGRNSLLLYIYEWLTRPLSQKVLLVREIEQIRIFRDMFSHHANTRQEIRIGDVVNVEQLPAGDALSKAQAVRKRVYQMRNRKEN